VKNKKYQKVDEIKTLFETKDNDSHVKITWIMMWIISFPMMFDEEKQFRLE